MNWILKISALNLLAISGIAFAQVPTPPVPPNPVPAIPAIQNNFSQCSATQQRTAIDNMCPRMEGSNLPNCCPPIQKAPALSCQYVIMLQRGQPTLVNSSYTTCQGGVNVTVQCCTPGAQACYKNPVTLTFIQRLISRSNQCCFEPCPPPQYWSAPPAKPGLPADWSQYSYYPGGSSECTGSVLNQCSVAGSPECMPSDFCPVTPSPTPTPSPGPAPTPSPGPGPAPSPSPSPGPAPGPAPSPAPAPQPPAKFGDG